MYQLLALIGQLVFGQSLAQWPRIANRPWLAESVTEFWGKRWHQFFRHFFVVYGSRPGKKVAGLYGSVMGAYLVSAHMYLVMIWGPGRGPELLHTAGFFVMLGVGTRSGKSGRVNRGGSFWVALDDVLAFDVGVWYG